MLTIHPHIHTRLEFPKENDPNTGKPPRVVRLDEEGKAVAAYGYKEGMELGFKDLGPQIGYRTGGCVGTLARLSRFACLIGFVCLLGWMVLLGFVCLDLYGRTS